MKALAARCAALAEATGALRAAEALDRRRDLVRVLAFHRIDEAAAEPDLDPGLLSASPALFRSQMRVVAERYHAISLADLVAAHRGDIELPAGAVLLTFDDGYADFARHAWPILQAFSLPATLFVPSDFVESNDAGFWWDRLHAALRRCERSSVEVEALGRVDLDGPDRKRAAFRTIRSRVKSLPHADAMKWLDAVIGGLAELPALNRVLGWPALAALVEQGLSVASHSCSHALATRVDAPTLEHELIDSRAVLEARLGPLAPVFAYPAGACDDASRAAVHAAGYEIALGTRRGVAGLPFADALDVMRLPVHRYAPPLFRAQLRPAVARVARALID